MSELYKHNIDLSERQNDKLKIAFKKRRSVTIGLASHQLTGGSDSILLTGEQHKAVNRAVKNSKGLRLTVSYDQLIKSKEGGLLKELLELVERVPGVKLVTPLVRTRVASVLKTQFVPWIKRLIDNELDSIMDKDSKGSGLKRCINKKLDSLLAEAKKKN